jgi:hypothetical protein
MFSSIININSFQVYVLMVLLEYESSCRIIYVEVVKKSNFYNSL